MRQKISRFSSVWLFYAAFLALPRAEAADIACTNLVQKNWSDPSAWEGGVVPTAGDDVFLEDGCGITVNVMNAAVRNLDINNGSLFFSTATSTRLTLSETLTITSGGTLTLGTEAHPIPAASSATLVLGNDAGNGLVFYSGSTVSLRGAPKSPSGQALDDEAAGSLNLRVPDAQADGWAVGDTITIGQTDRNASWVNETEERVITGLSSDGTNTTVSWTGGLTYGHAAATGIRVLNLTRNVLVRGPSATPGDEAVFRSWFDYIGDFHPAYVEFAYLSVQLSPVSDVSASSSSFHGGTGIFLASSGGTVTLFRNAIYNCLNAGVTPSAGMVFVENDVVASGSDGIQSNFSFSGGALIRDNHFYSNDGNGVLLKGVRNVVEDNRVYANNGGGLSLEGDQNYIAGNLFQDNDSNGVDYTGDEQAFVGNVIRENNGPGLAARTLSSGRNTYLVSNESYLNSNQGYHLIFPGTLMVKSASYVNATWGMTVRGSSITVVESMVGYTPAGAAAANGGSFTAIDHTGENLVLKGSRVNPAASIVSDAILSHNLNFATGTAKVDGNFVLQPGSSLALDNSQASWRSTATVPVLYHGADHSASVLSTSDSGAVSQFITIRCVDASLNRWVVEGSESGTMHGPFTGALSNQNIGGQFVLTFTPDAFGGQREGDRLGFVLLAAATDAGVRKQILFQDDATLTISTGAVFSLKGAAGTPALMDLDTGATTPFVFVSSGAFTLENAAVRRAAASGFQLSGAEGVAMSSVTFDSIGAAGGAYITARNLTSDTVMTSMSFDPSTVDANAPLSVRVLGADANLRWTFVDYSGNRTGNASDSDPNNRLYWVGSTPVGTPGSFAAAVFSDGLRLTWAAPSLPHAHFRGSYLLSYSSVSAAGPFTSLPSPSAGAVSQDHLSLLPETTYYYRLTASDLRGNTGAAAAASERTGDFSQPSILTIQSTELRTAGVGWASPLSVGFNKTMSVPAVTGAISLRRLRDGLGNLVSPPDALTPLVTPDVTSSLFTVSSTGPFMSNNTYELIVSTAARDPLAQPISSSATLRFTTLMNRNFRNVVTEGAGGAVVHIPAGALAADGYVEAGSSLPTAAHAATAKLLSNAGNTFRQPLTDGWADLAVLDAAGAPQASFLAPVLLKLPYADATNDGVVDNTDPPIKVSSLRVHRLDENLSLWQPLPGADVDAASHTVAALVPHFSAYALIGAPSTDLSSAHAFPNPFVAGKTGTTITFIALGQVSTVRIYTVDGLLVREMTTSDGSGRIDWDVRDADGEPLATGLYLYRVTSGDQSSTGRLAVVR